MRSFIRYFSGSTVFALVALGVSFTLGLQLDGSVDAGLTAAFTALILGVLETSLSFDNAVVNAKILGTMPPFWRLMFLTVGMVIAVFGMRIVFPLLLVWVVSSLPVGEVVAMTWQDPQHFQKLLVDQHLVIAGFGGSFLWLVFAKFFFDAEKELHWVPGLERLFAWLGKTQGVIVLIVLGVVLAFYATLPPVHRPEFLFASVAGVVVFLLVNTLGDLLRSPRLASGAGLGAFLYLEVLDASFSFDGVIGAFAITDSLFIIALGLGIGAFFVRSMTIKLVEEKTLGSLRYLEHGAFWAIGALALIMDLGALGVEIPEVVSGGVGLVFIGLSFVSSLCSRKKRE